MTKISDVTNGSVKGFFYLVIGMTFSTLISAINTILLGRLLGPDKYGLYTVILILPNVLVAICDFGISATLTRYLAYFRTQVSHTQNLEGFIKIGLILKFCISVIFSFLLIIYSDWISINILRRPASGYFLQLTSLFLIGQAIFDTLRSIFIVLDFSEKWILLINVNAITKLLSSLTLVLLGFNVSGAIYGASLGVILSSIIGFIILFYLSKPLNNNMKNEPTIKNENYLYLFLYGIPVYLSNIIGIVQRQAQDIILSFYESNANIGNWAITVNFTIFLVILSTPISSILFPAFSKLNMKIEKNMVEKIFQLSVKYSSLLLIPLSLTISVLSKYLVPMIYGNNYIIAPNFLSLYMLRYLGTGFGMFVIGSLLKGQENTKENLIMIFTKFIIAIPLSWIIIPIMGVYGIIISIITSEFISLGVGLLIIHRIYSIHVDVKSSLKIIISSFLSYYIVYYFINNIPRVPTLIIVISGSVLYFFSFYIITILLKGIINEDITNFERFSEALPYGKILVHYVIRILKKIIKLFHSI